MWTTAAFLLTHGFSDSFTVYEVMGGKVQRTQLFGPYFLLLQTTLPTVQNFDL